MTGVGCRVRFITDNWQGQLPVDAPPWVFYFHPWDLTQAGVANLRTNVEALHNTGVKFVTASEAAAALQ